MGGYICVDMVSVYVIFRVLCVRNGRGAVCFGMFFMTRGLLFLVMFPYYVRIYKNFHFLSISFGGHLISSHLLYHMTIPEISSILAIQVQ